MTVVFCSLLVSMGGHRHRSQCRRYPISDIDICYSDIGDKYVGLKNVIPISASEFIPISDIEEKIYISVQNRTCATWNGKVL
jgi:hypothetical protein